MFQQLHLFGDQLVAAFFSHHNWWLHTTVHWVLLGAPLSLAVLFILRLQAFARLYPTAAIPRNRGLAGRERSRHRGIGGSVQAYILSHTGRQQALLILLALASLPLLYATLEIPKQIINNAIGSEDFPILIAGIEAGQIEFLFGLCLIYLLALALNGSMKFSLNLSKGILSEVVLRRLRVEVLRRWHRPGLRRSSAQVIPIVVQEVEPIAGFAGDMLVLPIFQGGTFLTILFFLFMQDPLLGAAAVSLLPLQLLVIPRLQQRINQLGRSRMQEIRRLGEIIGGDTPWDTRNAIRAFRSIRTLQGIRIELFRRKFLMKGLYNFVTHLTPFFFYTIGGYLVIEGKLTFGALVAALAAHKDFSAPLRELFRYYQTSEDVRVRWRELATLLQP